MKILHVLYSGLGGHGNVFFSMVKADVNKQIEYEALFYGIEEVRKEYIDECNNLNIKFFTARKKRGFDLTYNKKLFNSIRTSAPDIVFLHGSSYILPAKIARYFSKNKYKIIVRETQANHLKTNIQWLTLVAAMQLADKIICLTDEFNAQIKKKIRGLYKKDKVQIIPNGIDLEVYKPAKRHINDTFIIGMQSRIVRIKDHTTLLHAFALLKETEKKNGRKFILKIAGDGDLKNELIQLSKDLHISEDVVFTGMLNEAQLTDFLGSLDLYVHASLGETMSTAIMQAMSCRLPVIASDVPGIKNMIKNNETGILVPVKNEPALANAILSAINNPVITDALKEAAYNFALLNYSNKTMFAKYQAVFSSLVPGEFLPEWHK